MPRFSTADGRALTSLKAELSSLQAGRSRESFFTEWLEELRPLLGLEKAIAYDVGREDRAFRVRWITTVGSGVPHPRFAGVFEKLISENEKPWGLFDPARPEPPQRNRTLVFPLSKELFDVADDSAQIRRLGLGNREQGGVRAGTRRFVEAMGGLGFNRHSQIRALVCEGDSLLAWVGGFRDEPPTQRESRLLDGLVPALQRRLSIERLLERGPLLEAALHATLEEVPRAAFIANGTGGVLYANAAGRAMLDRHPGDTRLAIAGAVSSGSSAELTSTPVRAPGRAPVNLVMARARDGIGGRLTRMARRWELTPRQRQVLALAVAGKANKTIAAALRCSERTIELHMTALLTRAGVDNRASLVARFFTA